MNKILAVASALLFLVFAVVVGAGWDVMSLVTSAALAFVGVLFVGVLWTAKKWTALLLLVVLVPLVVLGLFQLEEGIEAIQGLFSQPTQTPVPVSQPTQTPVPVSQPTQTPVPVSQPTGVDLNACLSGNFGACELETMASFITTKVVIEEGAIGAVWWNAVVDGKVYSGCSGIWLSPGSYTVSAKGRYRKWIVPFGQKRALQDWWERVVDTEADGVCQYAWTEK